MSSDVIQCYKITPGEFFDNLIVKRDEGGIETLLAAVENFIENTCDDYCEEEISIKCVCLSEEEFEELDRD